MIDLTGRTVLVTGAGGFIGSHLAQRLAADGCRVRALCRYSSNRALGSLAEVPRDLLDDIDVQFGDIRDASFVDSLLDGVDTVFHLAALIAIPYSYEAPRSFVSVNVEGTINVLEAARRSGVRRVVQTSTSEVYGTPDTTPITEAHPLRGQSPYSASKIAADKLCEAYALSFDVPVVTLRPFNTYGPRQSPRAVIPTVLGQMIAGVREIRLGSLHPQRDFTFVGDTVDGFIKIAKAEIQAGETIQLGTGSAVSIGDLFELCCRVTGTSATPVVDEQRIRPAASEVQVLLSDPARANEMLGWRPRITLEDGLRETANWLSSNVDSATIRTYHR